jgi:hypothetical protein
MKETNNNNKKTSYDDAMIYIASALDFKCFYRHKNYIIKRMEERTTMTGYVTIEMKIFAFVDCERGRYCSMTFDMIG